jgi:taurine dioxygenase
VAIDYERLSGSFGARVVGVDLAARRGDEVLRDIVRLFYESGFIVIPGQKLDLRDFDDVSSAFGTPRPHFLDHLRMANHPSILMLSNIFDAGKQIGLYEGACFWHTDVAYEDPPNSATVVYSIKAAPKTPTYLADMCAAYEALADSTKRRIDGLRVVHHYGNRDDTVEGSPTAAERLTEAQKQRVKNVYHPLVMRHPVTRRKALYGVAGSSFGIVGMPEAEALELLDELKVHATQPQFTMHHDYSAGDLAAWDTFATLHRAPRQAPVGPNDSHARLLWRISLTGVSRLLGS